MMTRHAKKGDYMPVGNIAMDMVTACIDHYKRSPKRLKIIYLNHSYWVRFKNYVLRNDPEYVIPDSGVEIEGCDVTVRRGHGLQVEPMMFDFYEKKVYQPIDLA